MENMKVKEEEVVIIVDDGGGGSSSNSSALLCPQPEERLYDIGPPPFLTKTYEMVEDPLTDTIVSWSTTRNSFIVWDLHKLSTNLLPKYFKHNNFSSFVRQLNTYGFKKVDPDRWEFANEGFLGGQKHLLKTIKRRRHVSQNMQQGVEVCIEVGQYGLEGELERLRRDRNTLMSEIMKLRQQQQSSHERLVAFDAQLQDTEKKQQQMMIFLGRAVKNPDFLQQLRQRNDHYNELLGSGVGRKRRLPVVHSAESINAGETLEAINMIPVTNYDNHSLTEVVTVESEIETLFSVACSNELDSQDQTVPGMNDLDSASATNIKWEELLNDDLIAGTDGETFESDVEVEDLVAQFPLLGDCVADLFD
ncbi:Heat stress transcription factor a-2 [Thalictrum thalictroides]|uniref:Heat stress transcription factor a-2 n=1 Tax=Thalictrum thalictroides TaxID=46969 RepID=A0A7J6V6J0_THATH|nr:Heat stress transcription factor a-2 [Thalictrum thalictroides]